MQYKIFSQWGYPSINQMTRRIFQYLHALQFLEHLFNNRAADAVVQNIQSVRITSARNIQFVRLLVFQYKRLGQCLHSSAKYSVSKDFFSTKYSVCKAVLV